MSSIVNGGEGITISGLDNNGNPTTQGFTVTWPNAGWPGITIIQPQPTSPPGVTLDYDENAVNFNEGTETYGVNFSVTNGTPFVVVFNIQYSSI